MKQDNLLIDHIFQKLDQSKKAMPKEAFLKRMEELAIAYVQSKKQVPRVTLYGIAASITILFFVNLYSIQRYQSTYTEQTAMDISSEQYDLIPSKSIYNE